MESDVGKIFVGGISEDTNEDGLLEYFGSFGEVLHVMIMKDRASGQKRGFGFVVFADPAVAEMVIREKHEIDGTMVEAKKAIPREDQRKLINRNNTNIEGSPAPRRTKKIFVGGLLSSVTEEKLKNYFEQFGTITDAVVMYDHNNQRPRGFGFITFDSEDIVDKVLQRTFHEIHGKMTEVKRAVPKEQSPGPTVRLPVRRHDYVLNSLNNFQVLYNEGYTPSSISSHGMRMVSRIRPLMGGRTEHPSFDIGHGIGMNFEPYVRQSYSENLNLNNNIGYGRALSLIYSGNATRSTNPIGYSAGSGNPSSSAGSTSRNNWWENVVIDSHASPARVNSFSTSGIENIVGFGNNDINRLGSSSRSVGHPMGGSSNITAENLDHSTRDNEFGLLSVGYGRSNDNASLNTSFTATRNIYEGGCSHSYGGSSIYGDSTWHFASNEIVGSSSVGYGLGATTSNVISTGSIDYTRVYDDITNKQINREQ